MIDAYTDRHVVVTGGMGALGKAVVENLLALGQKSPRRFCIMHRRTIASRQVP